MLTKKITECFRELIEGYEIATGLKLSPHEKGWYAKSVKQILGYVFVFVAVCSGFYLVSSSVFDDLNSSALTLSELWNKDIAHLDSAHLLPNGLKNLREIEWVTPNPESKVWAKYISSPFPVKKDGEYRLELLVLSQTDGGQLIAVIQHHLIHIPTGNSVWELGRTYDLASP